MNPGIPTSGNRTPPLPYGLLGNPTPVSMPDAYRQPHAEAADWAARVVANGGSATVTTILALSRFCNAIDASGIRDRFYRLNFFCGNNLAACLVPLYRNTSPALSPLGSATDTNVNFVGGDYNERVGLDANDAIDKYIDTGLTIDALPTRLTGHMSFFRRVNRVHPAGSATSPRVMGSIGAVNNHFYGLRGSNSFVQAIEGQLGHSVLSVSTGNRFSRPGLVLVSRDASNSMTIYFNAGRELFEGNGRTPGANANAITVFNWRQADGSVSAGAGWRIDISAYSVGAAMTPNQVLDYYTALVALYSSLGRAV